jgi:hypothetical protein
MSNGINANPPIPQATPSHPKVVRGPFAGNPPVVPTPQNASMSIILKQKPDQDDYYRLDSTGPNSGTFYSKRYFATKEHLERYLDLSPERKIVRIVHFSKRIEDRQIFENRDEITIWRVTHAITNEVRNFLNEQEAIAFRDTDPAHFLSSGIEPPKELDTFKKNFRRHPHKVIELSKVPTLDEMMRQAVEAVQREREREDKR